MATILTILDILVVLLVVFNVSQAIWKGPSGNPPSPILSVFATAAVLIFGIISFLGALGRTSASGVQQGALLIFLAATAGATRMWRASKTVPR